MLIGKEPITKNNEYGDVNTSHCNIFEIQIARANCSGKVEEILVKLHFTAIF
jgi:hypothetical protein